MVLLLGELIFFGPISSPFSIYLSWLILKVGMFRFGISSLSLFLLGVSRQLAAIGLELPL